MLISSSHRVKSYGFFTHRFYRDSFLDSESVRRRYSDSMKTVFDSKL